MTRWTLDPEGAAAALIAGVLEEQPFETPVLWAGAERPRVPDAVQSQAVLWNRRFGLEGAGTPEPTPGPFKTAVLRLPKSRAEQIMSVHLCLGALAADGRLIVYGGNDEGIRSFQKTLGELGTTTALATRGHGRVLELQRRDVATPVRGAITQWRQVQSTADGTAWVSYPGLFAGGEPDAGTTLLLANLPMIAAGAHVLDYGAGPGAIGAHIRRAQPAAKLTLLDNDSVALLAAAENVPGATLVAGDRLAVAGKQLFDLIVSNPPLHSGFKDDTGPLMRLIAEAPKHLAADGVLLMVVQRRIMLDRALADAFAVAELIASDSRYGVWRGTGIKPRAKADAGVREKVEKGRGREVQTRRR